VFPERRLYSRLLKQCSQLMVHYSRSNRARVPVVDAVHKQHVSSLAWGSGPTNNILFAGTVEDRDSGSNGHIAVVSLRTDPPTIMYRTQNIGEVDALGISPQGTSWRKYQLSIADQSSSGDRLAACVRGQGPPTLEIYALGNSGIQNPSKISTRSTRYSFVDSSGSSSSLAQAWIHLEPSDTRQVEVSFCKWSPCGTYIAVGRNDDRIDMFDSRFIKYGPVSRMFHGEPIKRTAWKTLWGITGLEWVEGAGYAQQALVSGGTDGEYYGCTFLAENTSDLEVTGCVRLWDVRHADPVCDTLAEMEADIAGFSVGDIGKREAPLVV
jgi:WD40 repeat protein